MISGAVFEQVHHRMSVRFDRLDARRLKNVSEPVVSYRVGWLMGRRLRAPRRPRLPVDDRGGAAGRGRGR